MIVKIEIKRIGTARRVNYYGDLVSMWWQQEISIISLWFHTYLGTIIQICGFNSILTIYLGESVQICGFNSILTISSDPYIYI